MPTPTPEPNPNANPNRRRSPSASSAQSAAASFSDSASLGGLGELDKTEEGGIDSATPTSTPAAPVRYRSFGCPRCRTRLFATKADVGKIVVCPDCDEKIVVPDYLDFETETDYERFNNPQKRRQDELLSPARNPNRVGIDVAGADIYGVKGNDDATVGNAKNVKTGSVSCAASNLPRGGRSNESGGENADGKSGKVGKSDKNETEKSAELVYYPVRCRVCETLTQAPAELLGKTVRCPDCGTETVVTAALKEQLATTDVRFQPRDRGVYELGAIPDAPDRVYQRFDGKTVFVPNSAKTIAPTPPKKPDASAQYPDKRKKRQGSAGEESGSTGSNAVAKPKRRSSREERERRRRLEEMKAEFGAVAVGEALKKARNDSTETTGERQNVGALGENPELERTLAILTVLTSPIRTLKRVLHRLATPPEIEDPTAFLPPLVLRYRNGEAIWTRPAPPRRFPLFNRTFQALATNELWARAGALVLTSLALIFYVVFLALPIWETQGTANPFAKLEFLVATIFAFPATLFWAYLTASFFEAIFGAGASGARRVLSWRDDDRLDGLLYALWFAALVGAAFSPGVALAGGLGWFESGEETAEALSGLQLVDLRIAATLAGSFAVCFPIFYLSTLYTGWPFAPICGAVLSSFLRRIVVWAQFWAVSAALVFAPLALGIRFFKTTTFWWAAPFALVVLSALYGLLLGRLAWILDEDERSLDYDD